MTRKDERSTNSLRVGDGNSQEMQTEFWEWRSNPDGRQTTEWTGGEEIHAAAAWESSTESNSSSSRLQIPLLVALKEDNWPSRETEQQQLSQECEVLGVLYPVEGRGLSSVLRTLASRLTHPLNSSCPCSQTRIWMALVWEADESEGPPRKISPHTNYDAVL